MRYYTIQGENDNVFIAENQEALTRFYDNVRELPEDYEEGKYIVGEIEEEIEVPDYDEEGNPIMIEYEDTETVIDYDEDGNPIGSHEITVIKHKQQTHIETIMVKALVLNPDYETEEAAKRKANFLSKFFKVPLAKSLVSKGYAYYRKEPKGYSSAIESISFAERMCSKLGGLPEGTLKFYKEPNFTKPEQCTEEWLVENQIALPALSVEDFDTLFIAFGQAWNTQEH